ncbi:MAG: hypothetical protein A2X22_10885 [Bacteroidetes bacterium GWF2_49_14]|nr:MAG: hypothetical protein A2X22_10885 [Bacteroidetes bacterium GWF2_49_14]HBB91411.1 hypothetical protein [Bacteroidales bacterium]
MIKGDQVILIDGYCNLCDRLARFVRKRDKKKKFTFISLQSAAGQLWLNKFGLPRDDFDTAVYIRGDRYFLKSSAILNIVKDMEGFWGLFYVFMLVPVFIRDPVYSLVAKLRYRIFGRYDSCKY